MLRGFGEWFEEDPRGRFCMLYRISRNYTRNGHDWNPMPDMELESLRGVRIFGRGFAKRGFGRIPGYGPVPDPYEFVDACMQTPRHVATVRTFRF